MGIRLNPASRIDCGHTDFSSGRKDLIKRDMAYSSDEKQIREIFAAEIAANVKKGWEEV